jgi:hypothetical protein
MPVQPETLKGECEIKKVRHIKEIKLWWASY